MILTTDTLVIQEYPFVYFVPFSHPISFCFPCVLEGAVWHLCQIILNGGVFLGIAATLDVSEIFPNYLVLVKIITNLINFVSLSFTFMARYLLSGIYMLFSVFSSGLAKQNGTNFPNF